MGLEQGSEAGPIEFGFHVYYHLQVWQGCRLPLQRWCVASRCRICVFCSYVTHMWLSHPGPWVVMLTRYWFDAC